MVEIINLGKIDYKKALDKQLKLVESLKSGTTTNEYIIICSHQPIVTLGKKSNQNDINGWSGETINVSRGGRATYHGPAQVVVYPIINIKNRGQDIGGYLRKLEESVVATLNDYGIKSKGDSNRTGVWTKNLKIASIGVAISKWITYHGLAFNLSHDTKAFKGINPCGFESNLMTDLETLLGHQPCRDTFENKLCSNLTNLLSIESWH